MSTTPKAADGSNESKVVTVKGDPCPPPTVGSVSLDWNGRTADVGVRAGGPGPVRLAAEFTRREAEGSAKVVDRANRTLTGGTSYNLSLRGALGDVACGTTAYFGARVTTEPAAANGTQFKEVRVSGPKCAPPTVSITSWDGSTLTVRVKNATADPVKLSAAFEQTLSVGERTVTRTAAQQATLSGDTAYDRVYTVRFATPACGYSDARRVTVNVSSALGTASDSARSARKGDPCAEPTKEPTREPTKEPTKEPTREPTRGPTEEPSPGPSGDQSDGPVIR